MCKNQFSSKEIDHNDIENARVGYQAAINLWIYQGGEIWARFNVMLVANSILIGVIGLNITNGFIGSFFSGILSIFGFLICFAWFFLMKRSNDYQKYYLYSARELEEKHLFNTVNTVSKGGTFGNGDSVYRIIDDKPKPFKMNKYSHLFRTENISYFIIFLFICLFILIYIFSLILLHINSL